MVDLDDWDRLGREVPCLLNLLPSGEYLMEDFYYAGGLPAVIRELAFEADGCPHVPSSPALEYAVVTRMFCFLTRPDPPRRPYGEWSYPGRERKGSQVLESGGHHPFLQALQAPWRHCCPPG